MYVPCPDNCHCGSCNDTGYRPMTDREWYAFMMAAKR